MAKDKKESMYLKEIDANVLDVYMKSCLNAMKSIAHNTRVVVDTENQNSSVLERNYVLSLVYEMGKQISKNEFEFNSSGLFIGGETSKYIRVNSEKIRATCNELDIKIKEKKFEVIPDLVIHNSHNPDAGDSGDGQRLALEAKTTINLGKVAFMKDFFKLNVYLASLHFENVVYLIVNNNTKRICELIEDYLNNEYFLFKEGPKMFFFIQEKIEDEPKVFQFIDDDKR